MLANSSCLILLLLSSLAQSASIDTRGFQAHGIDKRHHRQHVARHIAPDSRHPAAPFTRRSGGAQKKARCAAKQATQSSSLTASSTTTTTTTTPTPTPAPTPEPKPAKPKAAATTTTTTQAPSGNNGNGSTGGGSTGGGGGVGGGDFGGSGGGDNSGDGTYYDTGLVACGQTFSNSDAIVAVSIKIFDNYPGATGNPNNNPICGKRIHATYNGNSVVVAVQDRCTGCSEFSLDFTPSVFQQLADMSLGRIHPVVWYWLD